MDYVIPVSSHDVDTFSKYTEDPILSRKMLILENTTHELLHNKLTCYKYLDSINIKTPKILNDNLQITFPVVMKPSSSSGSKGVHILTEMDDYEYWNKKEKSNLLIEFLEGPEYTVDCFFSSDSCCKGFNIRERKKTVGGGAVVSQNDYRYEKEIKNVIKIIEEHCRIRGPINFQFKVKNNEIYIFDFNTRFASGGLPLTVESGYDIPSILLDAIDGKDIPYWECKMENRAKKMVRYYDEVFFDENSSL